MTRSTKSGGFRITLSLAACALAFLVTACGTSQAPAVPAPGGAEPVPQGIKYLKHIKLPRGWAARAGPHWHGSHETITRPGPQACPLPQ